MLAPTNVSRVGPATKGERVYFSCHRIGKKRDTSELIDIFHCASDCPGDTHRVRLGSSPVTLQDLPTHLTPRLGLLQGI